MIISEARTWVRQFAREANDSSVYGDDQIDRAIQGVGNDFLMRTDWKTTNTLTLTAGSAALPAFPTGFLPERLERAYISGLTAPVPASANGLPPTLTVVNYEWLYGQMLLISNPLPGFPQFVAFNTQTTGIVGPVPDSPYSVLFSSKPTFTTWTPGTEDGPTLAGSLLLPDDYMQSILTYGATSFLQHTSEKHKYAGTSWAKYLEFVERKKAGGAGTLGAQVTYRTPPHRTGFRRVITGWLRG